MALDEADLAKITELFTKLAGEQAKALPKMVETEIGKALKAADLEGKIKALIPEPPKAGEGEGDGDGKAADKSASGGESQELRKIQAQLVEVQKQAKEQAKRAEEAEAKRQQEMLVNGVRDALVSAGADAKKLPIALAYLEKTGMLKLNESGVPGFVMQRSWGPEIVPAADAAKEWLATEDGKNFVPPANTGGTGDGAGRKAATTGRTASADAIIGAALARI